MFHLQMLENNSRQPEIGTEQCSPNHYSSSSSPFRFQLLSFQLGCSYQQGGPSIPVQHDPVCVAISPHIWPHTLMGAHKKAHIINLLNNISKNF